MDIAEIKLRMGYYLETNKYDNITSEFTTIERSTRVIVATLEKLKGEYGRNGWFADVKFWVVKFGQPKIHFQFALFGLAEKLTTDPEEVIDGIGRDLSIWDFIQVKILPTNETLRNDPTAKELHVYHALE